MRRGGCIIEVAKAASAPGAPQVIDVDPVRVERLRETTHRPPDTPVAGNAVMVERWARWCEELLSSPRPAVDIRL